MEIVRYECNSLILFLRQCNCRRTPMSDAYFPTTITSYTFGSEGFILPPMLSDSCTVRHIGRDDPTLSQFRTESGICGSSQDTMFCPTFSSTVQLSKNAIYFPTTITSYTFGSEGFFLPPPVHLRCPTVELSDIKEGKSLTLTH